MTSARLPLVQSHNPAVFEPPQRGRDTGFRRWIGRATVVAGATNAEDADPQYHLVATSRLFVAASGLVLELTEVSEASGILAAPLVLMALFCLHSAILSTTAAQLARSRWELASSHWLDLAWWTALILVSQRTTTVLLALLSAILFAALRRGHSTALRITIASSLLFGGIGYLTVPATTSTALMRAAFYAASVLVLGYLASSWADIQLSLLRQLSFLKDVATLSNPRFGVDRTIANLLDRIRTYYEADACLVLTPIPNSDEVVIRRRSAGSGTEGIAGCEVTAVSVAPLLAVSEKESFSASVTPRTANVSRLDFAHDRPSYDEWFSKAAEMLEAHSFATVPWIQRGSGPGRLFVAFKEPRSIDRFELGFLQHVVAQSMPMLDNVRLVDRLASDAADTERRRIALDLHDSVVQPYIGVRFALAAMREKLRREENVAADVEQLDNMIALEIGDLRQYLSGLQGVATPKGVLVDALQKFSDRFSEATGIAVRLTVAERLTLNDRLAAEIFQLVVEGLSNIRRHGEASAAAVRLSTSDDRLLLQIEDAGQALKASVFTPKSLTERVEALGGRLRVGTSAMGGAAVTIEIPL